MKKKYPFLMLILTLLLGFNSCSSDGNIDKEVSIEEAMSNFNNAIILNSYELTSSQNANLYTPSSFQWVSKNSNKNSFEGATKTLTTTEAEAILIPMSEPTNQLMLDIGFSQMEIDYLFDTEEEKASVGLLFHGILLEYNSQNLGVIQDSDNSNKTVDCLLEATGVSGFIGAVGVLAGQALTKTVVKKAIKTLATTVGKRAIGVIGLAIMVGEFTWCMNR